MPKNGGASESGCRARWWASLPCQLIAAELSGIALLMLSGRPVGLVEHTYRRALHVRRPKERSVVQDRIETRRFAKREVVTITPAI